MKKLIRLCYAIGAAGVITAASGGSSPLQAQHGQDCWQCTWYAPGQYFACAYGGTIGSNSCTIISGGCVTGSRCGLYRPLADGTFNKRKSPSSTSLSTLKAVASRRSSSVRVSLASRLVERACDGTIVRRNYDALAGQGLKRATRTIRV